MSCGLRLKQIRMKMSIVSLSESLYQTIFFLLISMSAFSQKVDSDVQIKNMEIAIKQFLIEKGEINDENKLGIGVYDVTHRSELGKEKIGIYLIRAVYRTDGNDYILLKDDQDLEFFEFKDLRLILRKAMALLKDESDDELFIYINSISEYYEGSYLFIKNGRGHKIKMKTN